MKRRCLHYSLGPVLGEAVVTNDSVVHHMVNAECPYVRKRDSYLNSYA